MIEDIGDLTPLQVRELNTAHFRYESGKHQADGDRIKLRINRDRLHATVAELITAEQLARHHDAAAARRAARNAPPVAETPPAPIPGMVAPMPDPEIIIDDPRPLPAPVVVTRPRPLRPGVVVRPRPIPTRPPVVVTPRPTPPVVVTPRPTPTRPVVVTPRPAPGPPGRGDPASRSGPPGRGDPGRGGSRADSGPHSNPSCRRQHPR